ncbi:hypothetical protein [Kurthia huakuii]|uniref:hypothetical protein n=1 Tax=Kurthia huakuii TaxID=1421019 RepID=UPI0004976041|nr:hypothetical protein [Kurthia huakuii]MBM7699116.1 hypothetical protein [Kurthia huakuii]
MNPIRKQLQQKIGDTASQEQRVKIRVAQRMNKRKKPVFQWFIALSIIAICMSFFSVKKEAPQQIQTEVDMGVSVEVGDIMINEKTGQTKGISELLVDEVREALHAPPQAKLLYTPARYTNNDYVTTRCGKQHCPTIAVLDHGNSGSIAKLGNGTVQAEILSKDQAMVLIIMRTENEAHLHFSYTNGILDTPKITQAFPPIKTATWLTNEKIRLTFTSGKTKIVNIVRYY